MIRFMCFLLLIVSLSVSCSEDEAKSHFSELESFSIDGLSADFIIGADYSVEAMAPDEFDLSKLKAVFKVSDKARVFVGTTIQTSGYTQNDFTKPVVYLVEAEDGSKTSYTVTIYKDPKIKSFGIQELPNVVFTITDQKIEGEVLNGTDLSDLTAVFSLTENARLLVGEELQVSGESKNNFQEPFNYTLIGASESEKEYTLTITEASNNAPVAIAGADKLVLVEEGVGTAMVSLDGSLSSDIEGDIAKFEWLENGEIFASTASVEHEFAIGIHNIQLKVTDSKGLSASDDLLVEVRLVGNYQPVDADASQETINLYKSLGKIANSEQFLFGQEHPLSFQLGSIRHDLSTSDCKEVTGDHPAVYGIDPHYMLYKTDQEKETHINEAKHAYQNGSVVTFDFHQQSRTDHSIYFSDLSTQSDKELVYDIVNDKNGTREWFYAELDEILNIINNDLGFPVVFRLFHEMDGNWFWWGTSTKNHSPELYKEFYQLAADYIKGKTNLVLFAWSPNAQVNESYYPGDAYVDVVGFDLYEPSKTDLKSKLIDLSNFAYEHNKVAILAETGDRNAYTTNDPDFWTSKVLAAIKEGGSEVRIAWVLAWFNAPWSSSQDDLFIPNSNSSTESKDDFVTFEKDAQTLFQTDAKALNIYQ
ncbi:glycosyl hydrolase [Marinifilum sp. RC60d5]|uniref:glycosyl hydrolase n=1 Tax=Marinifilum sp. RC60d5 TaxID=3458414 RepID=UPI0040372258